MSQELKALEILKDFVNNPSDYGMFQDMSEEEITNYFKEAIEELEQYEQKFKQEEFKYRTECQNVLSIGRIEADNMPDKLAELEKVILDYYLNKGYQIGVGDWGFEVEILSKYKSKWIKILFWDREEGIREECYKDMSSINTKEMFDKAIEYFSTHQHEVANK